MTCLPPWLDTRDPEAARGTARVRSVDPHFLIGLDRRRGVFQLWGPSFLKGGWHPLQDITDDHGNALVGVVPWELVVAALVRARRAGNNAADRVEAHNAALRQQQHAALSRRNQESAKYCARAIGAEADGASRFSPDDVMAGLRNRWA